jgi:putative transposase
VIKATRRHLPHFYVVGQPLFVTFRLHGSLPQERNIAERTITTGQAFACYDRLLDGGSTGPLYLRVPEVAEIVIRSIEEIEVETNSSLHAWVVMPNHVHLLMTPFVDPALILRRLKGGSARQANLALNRQGHPFWQHESYDRLVRSADEFRRIERYIVWNPVRAGLVGSPELYLWSSASASKLGAEAG